MQTTQLDAWTAYQFDSAVALVGNGIEGALNETVSAGDSKLQPKYSLEELLDPGFKMMPPPTKAERQRAAVESLRAMVGKGVKVFKVPSG